MRPAQLKQEDWHELIYKFMPLAAKIAVSFALKHKLFVSEYVAESYFWLTVLTLKYIEEKQFQIDDKFNIVKHLSMALYRKLMKYKMSRKEILIADALGPYWEEKYLCFTNKVPLSVNIETLFRELTPTDRDLAIVTMHADGYSAKDIANNLNFDVKNVRRTINRIYFLLSNS